MTVPVLPLKNLVIFPNIVTPLLVSQLRSVSAVDAAMQADKRIFLATQHDATIDNPKPTEIFQVGTISNIVQSLKLPDGNTKVLVEGIERARVLHLAEEENCWKATLRLSPGL